MEVEKVMMDGRQRVVRVNPQAKKGEKEMAKEKKNEAAKAEKAPAKEVKPKSVYDHLGGSQAALIDSLVIKGSSMADMIKGLEKFCGKEFKGDAWAKGRIKSHIDHLKKSHKLTIHEKDDFFQIKEGAKK